MESEQTVVEVNGKKIDLSRIGNERVAKILKEMRTETCFCGYEDFPFRYDEEYKYSEYKSRVYKDLGRVYKDGRDGYYDRYRDYKDGWYR